MVRSFSHCTGQPYRAHDGHHRLAFLATGKRLRLRHAQSASQRRSTLAKQVLCRAGPDGDDTVLPPRTYAAAVQQARRALRLFREDKAANSFAKDNAADPYRVIIDLPLRPPGGLLFAKEPEERIRLLDESDWPGGMIQRFRSLRPMVESLLDGYDATFVGMLEDESDGVGVWTTTDLTAVAIVTNATFPAFEKLCTGGLGAKPTQREHTVLAVNPSWTSSADIGQPWQWALKQSARRLIDDTRWEVLFHCALLRTAAGAHGLLHRVYPSDWALYSCADGSAELLGRCVLRSAAAPPQREVVAALNSERSATEEQFQEQLQQQGGNRWW